MDFLLRWSKLFLLLLPLAVVLALIGVAEPIVWVCFFAGAIPMLLIAALAWVGW